MCPQKDDVLVKDRFLKSYCVWGLGKSKLTVYSHQYYHDLLTKQNSQMSCVRKAIFCALVNSSIGTLNSLILSSQTPSLYRLQHLTEEVRHSVCPSQVHLLSDFFVRCKEDIGLNISCETADLVPKMSHRFILIRSQRSAVF